MGKKKSRRPSVNLDEMNLAVVEVEPTALIQLRGLEVEKPISEIAIKMANEMKKGKSLDVRVASMGMVLTTRRLLLDELERIVRGSDLTARCVENGTQLTFSYVKR